MSKGTGNRTPYPLHELAHRMVERAEKPNEPSKKVTKYAETILARLLEKNSKEPEVVTDGKREVVEQIEASSTREEVATLMQKLIFEEGAALLDRLKGVANMPTGKELKKEVANIVKEVDVEALTYPERNAFAELITQATDARSKVIQDVLEEIQSNPSRRETVLDVLAQETTQAGVLLNNYGKPLSPENWPDRAMIPNYSPSKIAGQAIKEIKSRYGQELVDWITQSGDSEVNIPQAFGEKLLHHAYGELLSIATNQQEDIPEEVQNQLNKAILLYIGDVGDRIDWSKSSVNVWQEYETLLWPPLKDLLYYLREDSSATVHVQEFVKALKRGADLVDINQHLRQEYRLNSDLLEPYVVTTEAIRVLQQGNESEKEQALVDAYLLFKHIRHRLQDNKTQQLFNQTLANVIKQTQDPGFIAVAKQFNILPGNLSDEEQNALKNIESQLAQTLKERILPQKFNIVQRQFFSDDIEGVFCLDKVSHEYTHQFVKDVVLEPGKFNRDISSGDEISALEWTIAVSNALELLQKKPWERRSSMDETRFLDDLLKSEDISQTTKRAMALVWALRAHFPSDSFEADTNTETAFMVHLVKSQWLDNKDLVEIHNASVAMASIRDTAGLEPSFHSIALAALKYLDTRLFARGEVNLQNPGKSIVFEEENWQPLSDAETKLVYIDLEEGDEINMPNAEIYKERLENIKTTQEILEKDEAFWREINNLWHNAFRPGTHVKGIEGLVAIDSVPQGIDWVLQKGIPGLKTMLADRSELDFTPFEELLKARKNLEPFLRNYEIINKVASAEFLQWRMQRSLGTVVSDVEGQLKNVLASEGIGRRKARQDLKARIPELVVRNLLPVISEDYKDIAKERSLEQREVKRFLKNFPELNEVVNEIRKYVDGKLNDEDVVLDRETLVRNVLEVNLEQETLELWDRKQQLLEEIQRRVTSVTEQTEPLKTSLEQTSLNGGSGNDQDLLVITTQLEPGSMLIPINAELTSETISALEEPDKLLAVYTAFGIYNELVSLAREVLTSYHLPFGRDPNFQSFAEKLQFVQNRKIFQEVIAKRMKWLRGQPWFKDLPIEVQQAIEQHPERYGIRDED